MKLKERISCISFKLRNNLFVFEYIVFIFVVFTAAFCALKFPETASKGVYDGMMLCLKNVVPSLFPFMIVSSVIAQSGLTYKLSGVLSPLMNAVFRQPGAAFSVIVLSQIGGFPVGASLIKQLYEKGELTEEQGQRLMVFCINPGPAFVMSYIGSSLLNSLQAGVIIYISVVASSLILGFFTRFFADFTPTEKQIKKDGFASPSEIFVRSVKSASKTMLSVCSWVVVFSCIEQLLLLLKLSQGEQLFLSILLEVTNGCKNAVGLLPLPAIAGAIGWCGVCIHFQVMDTIIKVRLKLKYFLATRVLNAAIAMLISHILFKIFPVSVAVSALRKAELEPTSSGLMISVCLIIMCLLVIIGDNTTIILKRKGLQK